MRLTILLVLALGLAGVGLLALASAGEPSTKTGLQNTTLHEIPMQDLTGITSADECPEDRLPAEGDPVTGSVGLRAGGYSACGDVGMLAPQVFSITDGATGLPLTGRLGLDASTNGLEFSISPDNSVLVISATPTLSIIDLRTWSEIAAVDFPEGVPLDPQVWSPDGSKVYLRLGWSSRMRTGPSIHNDRRIWQLDVASATLSRLPDLPFDSFLSPAISADGRLLYALGFDRNDRDYSWVARGDPFLSAIDLASGDEVLRIPLPDLKLGADDDDVTHRPAGVLDDTAGRYYVAHADSDAITVIDLKTGEIVTKNASAATPKGFPARMLDGLASLFVSTAEAKGGGSHQRQAALSPDGGLLFVTGMDQVSAEVDDADDDTSGAVPSGLRVIDTRTLRVLHHEAGISRFLLTEDNRYLFGIGCAAYFKNGWAPQDCAGLKVLDLDTMELAAHIEPGTAYLNMALTLDGRYLHLTSEGPGRKQMRREGLDSCDEPCIDLIVDVVEVDSLNLVSRQDSEVGIYPISKWNNSR